VPLSEDAEAYDVRVVGADGGIIRLGCTAPSVRIWGDLVPASPIEVRQTGAQGPSVPATVLLP
jgi:hypothetical protein